MLYQLSYSARVPFSETCASGRSVTFWATECYTPPVRLAAAKRTVFATWAGEAVTPPTRTTGLPPSSRPQGLALDNSPLFSAVDVWRRDSAGCYTRHRLSICHPRWSISHLPASLRVTSKPLELGLPGCPHTKRGGQTGLLPLYVPFNTPIYRRQAAKI